MEALDDLLNFSDDDEKTKLPSSSMNRHRDDDLPSIPEFAEEELEWLSNKDAFPAVESGIFFDNQNHLSPVSVLENSSSSSSSTITSCCGTFLVPISFPVRERSTRRRKRRRRFPELYSQQGWWWNQVNIKNLKQEHQKPSFSPGTFPSDATTGRRCQHCLAEKTPLWRAGPMGPKTLCNACGVRYKSGRLVPEYRPASSPTFSSELHSNSHRKIMEKRSRTKLEK